MKYFNRADYEEAWHIYRTYFTKTQNANGLDRSPHEQAQLREQATSLWRDFTAMPYELRLAVLRSYRDKLYAERYENFRWIRERGSSRFRAYTAKHLD